MGCGSSSAEPSNIEGATPNIQPPPVKLVELGVLGSGASCKVLEVEDMQKNHFAHKVLVKEGGLGESVEDNRAMFLNEVAILKKLNHPNIVKMHWSWEDKDHFNLVTDMCTGGELFDKIKKMDHFSEVKASHFARSMFSALQACHDNMVVHRDLKPENFVLLDSEEGSGIVLIDFGCAVTCETEDTVIDDLAGTPYYLAPEVLSEDEVCTLKTWKCSDVWSLGVILYVMVIGDAPFRGRHLKDIFRCIRKQELRFPDGVSLSKSCKDLIRFILNKNPRHRPSIKEILKHPWLNTEEVLEDVHLEHVLGALEGFQESNALKKAVANMLANDMSDKDHDRLEKLFKKFDTNKTGKLGEKEIAAMMRVLGHNANLLQKVMDHAGEEGTITLETFVQMELEGEIGESEDMIHRAYTMLDHEGHGHLTVDDIVSALHMDPEVVKEMVGTTPEEEDNKSITYEEFKAAMSSHAKQTKKKIRTLASVHTTSKKKIQT